MSKRTKAPATNDPVTDAHQKLLERQRKNARRALLKRRRRKSHQ